MLTSWILVIANIVLIECLLSLDNAAVLATMVLKVDKPYRRRLYFLGVFLAYFFRVVALLSAFWLVKFWQLKVFGGVYLIFLGGKTLFFPNDSSSKIQSEANFFDLLRKKLKITPFYSAVLSVGLMDLVFSIDNVFVVVALSDNIYLIWFGVLVAIVSMMFVVRLATYFIDRYPALHTAVLYVIIVLGLKLVLSGLDFLYPEDIRAIVHHKYTSLFVSLFILSLFTSVILFSMLKYRKTLK